MDKIEELETKIKELSEEIERLKKAQEHNPRYGEKYWFISLSSGVMSSLWYGSAVDIRRYELGNVFKTKEEAEFRAEQLKVEAELRRFSRPFVANEDNYSIVFKHGLNTIRTWHGTTWQHDKIYFATAEIAQKAINTVGADRIKKYYFGVEER